MNKDRIDERLKDHARRMRPFWDELEKIGAAPDAASDPFRLPYTSEPDQPQRDFKLTFPA
jgi:hypothetical protein